MNWRRRLLLANGVFLVVVGGVQVGFEAAVHTLLGTANLVFWDSFVVFGMIPMGIAATAVHFTLVAAHSGAWMVSRDGAGAR